MINCIYHFYWLQQSLIEKNLKYVLKTNIVSSNDIVMHVNEEAKQKEERPDVDIECILLEN